MIPKIFKMYNKKGNRDRANFKIFNKGKIQDLTPNRDQSYLQKRSHKIFLKTRRKIFIKNIQNIKIKLILISISRRQLFVRSH